jgi:hypothetical protein
LIGKATADAFLARTIDKANQKGMVDVLEQTLAARFVCLSSIRPPPTALQ